MVSRLMLGNRQSVTVVRYRDKDMVLGVTDSSITLLSESEADESDEATSPRPNFAALLRRKTTNEE